jgi:hypothetical protein
MPDKADTPDHTENHTRNVSFLIRSTDILADYRQWRSMQEDRIGTHSDDCHMWPRHERCMIHRLAAALERERQVLVPKNTSTENGEKSHLVTSPPDAS